MCSSDVNDRRPIHELFVYPTPCLTNPEVLTALRPTVTTAFIRTTWMIATEGGGRIELAFDRGHIHAGARRLPLCEIELELKHGPAAVIFDFALALADAVPLRIGEDSKAVRGFSAIAAGAPDWSKARKLVHAGIAASDDSRVAFAPVPIAQEALVELSGRQPG